jgi:putative SOS response-associated peptidase YedK
MQEGETTKDVFGFLTTEPIAEVGAFHPKAMPVILISAKEIDLWITGTRAGALTLRRPLPDNPLRVVARGLEKDGAGSESARTD